MKNYPDGVTGNEPQISGIYPLDRVVDDLLDRVKKAQGLIENIAGELDDDPRIASCGSQAEAAEAALQELHDALMPYLSDDG